MTESSDPLFRRFRERKLFRVLVLYVGVAWGLAQVAEFVVDNYELSRRLLDVTLFLLLVGLPAAAVIAWFHGEKGHQRVQRVEGAILAALLAVAAAGAWVIGTSGDAISADRDLDAVVDLGEQSVAVMPFDVVDPELDWLRQGAAELLTTGLASHEAIRVVSGQRLFDLLRLEGQEEATVIPTSMASRLTRRAGARYLVDGSVLGAAGDLVMRADLVDVETGGVEASAQARGADVFDLVDRVAADLARQIVRGTIGSTELASVASVTTRNPEAYRAYLLGLLAERRFHAAEALRGYEEAVALDSTFALAQMRLASIALQNGDISRAVEALRLAREHRDAAPERDRMYLDALLAQLVNGNTEESRRILERLLAAYPDDAEARAMLAQQYPAQSEERGRLLRETIRLDPLNAEAHNSLAYFEANRGNFGAADSLIARYVELEPDEPNPRDSRGEILMMAGRHEEAREQFRTALELGPGFEPALRHLAESWAAEGRFAEGLAELERIIDASDAADALPAYPALATLHTRRGRLEAALEALEARRRRALSIDDPRSANTAIVSQIPFLVALGDRSGVARAADALAEGDPLSPFGPYARLVAAAEGGDLGTAVAIADSVMLHVRTTPGLEPFAELMEAVTSRELAFYGGDHERALEWHEAVGAAGGWPEIGSYTAPRALLALRRYDEALERARGTGSFTGPAQTLAERLRLYYMARAHEGRADTASAVAAYERLLEHEWPETASRVALIDDAPGRLRALKGVE